MGGQSGQGGPKIGGGGIFGEFCFFFGGGFYGFWGFSMFFWMISCGFFWVYYGILVHFYRGPWVYPFFSREFRFLAFCGFVIVTAWVFPFFFFFLAIVWFNSL